MWVMWASSLPATAGGAGRRARGGGRGRVRRAQGVAQAGLDVGDVGFEFACDGGGAEAAVQEPDGVGFALQDADHAAQGGGKQAGGGELGFMAGDSAGLQDGFAETRQFGEWDSRHVVLG